MFWLPEEERQFYGRVRHRPEHGTEFWAVDMPIVVEDDGRAPAFLPFVHGESVEGDAVSLLGVYVNGWTLATTTTVDALVERVLLGSPHIADLEALRLVRATVQVHGLREAFLGVWPYGGGVLRPREIPSGVRDELKTDAGDAATLRIRGG